MSFVRWFFNESVIITWLILSGLLVVAMMLAGFTGQEWIWDNWFYFGVAYIIFRALFVYVPPRWHRFVRRRKSDISSGKA